MNFETIQLRKQPPAYAYLVVTTTERAGSVHQLNRGTTTLGRSGANDIRLDDASVSGEHAKIRFEGDGQFTLIDLGSSNGAKLNGRRTQQHTLRHNDVIELGETRLVFKRVS